MAHPPILHLGMEMLHAFVQQHSRPPAPWDAADNELFLELANKSWQATHAEEPLDEQVKSCFLV